MIENKSVLTPFNVAMPLWLRRGNRNKFQRFIIPYGRMSLSNYITQSIIGCFIYLSYGLGLYDDAGATVSLLIGFTTFGAQLLFSIWWRNRYQQGPLGRVWKKLTWVNRKVQK